MKDRKILLENVEKLKSILQLRHTPINTGTDLEWQEFEKKLGSRVPTDFYQFIRTYGEGTIGDDPFHFTYPFYISKNPDGTFDSEPYLFLRMRTEYIETMEIFKKDFSEKHAIVKKFNPETFEEDEIIAEELPIWPEKDGVFQIGTAGSEYAQRICYRMKGEPDQWTILVSTDLGNCEYVEYNMGIVDFLMCQFEVYEKRKNACVFPYARKVESWIWKLREDEEE